MAEDYNRYEKYPNNPSLPPLQLCFFIMVVLFLLFFSWYINYESIWESFMDQVKLVLMLSPLLLILAVHWLSSAGGDRWLLIPLPEQVGESPWGVAIVLVFLFYMVSFHKSIRETWWPLLSK